MPQPAGRRKKMIPSVANMQVASLPGVCDRQCNGDDAITMLAVVTMTSHEKLLKEKNKEMLDNVKKTLPCGG